MEGFKVVIVGGGSSHTPGIIQSLIGNLDRFPLQKLVLYDIDPDRLELVDTLCGSLIAKLDPACVYFTTTDPKEAFTDIDFAFVLFLHKILDVSFFVPVFQLVYIVVHIHGADLSDLIAALPQTADADLTDLIAVFAPIVLRAQPLKGLGNACGGGSPQLIRPEMGGIKQFVKRFDIRNLKFCDLIVGEDNQDEAKLGLERKSYQDFWCPTAGAGTEISYFGQLCP